MYSCTELRKYVLIKLMMKVEEKKNLVAICYEAMLLLISHVTSENPFTPRQTHNDVGSEGTNGGVNVGKFIQIKTIVM